MDGIATGLAYIVPYNPVGLNAVSLAIASGVVSESFSFLITSYNFHSWLLILLFLLSAITASAATLKRAPPPRPRPRLRKRNDDFGCGRRGRPRSDCYIWKEKTMQNLNEASACLILHLPRRSRIAFTMWMRIRIRPAPVL